jgi:hypothetical protein
LFSDDEKEDERDGIHEFDSPSLSTTLDNAIGTGDGDGEVSCAKFSSLLSMIDDGDDDNIDDAATVDWEKLASLFVSTPSLLLQPVMPAKQLWVKTEIHPDMARTRFWHWRQRHRTKYYWHCHRILAI